MRISLRHHSDRCTLWTADPRPLSLRYSTDPVLLSGGNGFIGTHLLTVLVGSYLDPSAYRPLGSEVDSVDAPLRSDLPPIDVRHANAMHIPTIATLLPALTSELPAVA